MRITLPNQSVYLRDWKTKDLQLYKEYNTGHHEWMNYDGPYYPKLTPAELEKQLEFLQKKISSQEWSTPRKKLVISDSTDQLLGTVSWYWQSKETHWLSIGLALYNPEIWNKGIGFQALQIWCQYLFGKNQDLARLDLRTWSGNPGMIRLGNKLGFINEARFRNARIVNGKYYDSIGMGILREEWQQKQLIVS